MEEAIFVGVFVLAGISGLCGSAIYVGRWNDTKTIELIKSGVSAPEAVCVIHGCDTKTWLLIRGGK